MTRLFRLPLLFALAGAVPAFADIISVHPSAVTVTAGQHFSIDLNVTGGTDIFGFQLDLGFNPLAVKATPPVTEGSFLKSIGLTSFFPGVIDNSTGVISFIGASLFAGGASGDGTLATVDFTALATGSGTFTPFNLIVLNSFGEDVAVTGVSGTVRVTDAEAAVPEPASVLLLLTAAGALALVRSRRRA